MPRSGSSHFCDLLNSTNLFNPVFKEYFNPKTTTKFSKHHNCDIFDCYDKQGRPDHYTRFNKIFSNHFYETAVRKKQVEERFPNIKYILYRRKDWIASAVSRFFAVGTDIWGVVKEPRRQKFLNKEVPFNANELLNCYEIIKKRYYGWDAYLANRDYLELYYEDLIEDEQGTMQKTFDYLDISYTGKLHSRLLKQTRPETEEYKKKLEKIIKLRVI